MFEKKQDRQGDRIDICTTCGRRVSYGIACDVCGSNRSMRMSIEKAISIVTAIRLKEYHRKR